MNGRWKVGLTVGLTVGWTLGGRWGDGTKKNGNGRWAKSKDLLYGKIKILDIPRWLRTLKDVGRFRTHKDR